MNVFELFGTIAIDGTKANGALDKISKNARATGKAMQDAFNKIGNASVKIGKVVAGAGVAVGGAWVAAIEGSRDYRTEMAKLDAAFTTNGHSAEAATKTYQDLQAVLGETDQSVEAANHLAVMCDNEEDLAKWTDICTGVFATFGDSLPIEGLTESANETAKVGQVTGLLADALNWAGISEEDFNLKLRACRTEQERQELIMNHLSLAYKNASEQYQKTAEDIMKANRAQESWNSAMAALGAIGEPILTAIKQKAADMVLAVVPHLENFITKFREIENVWTDVMWPLVQSTFKVAFGVDVPEWSAIESNITTWWTGTAKPAIEQRFKATFGIDPPEWSAIPETITSWWTQTAKPKIEETAKAIMSITPPDLAGLANSFNMDWTNLVMPTLTGLLTGNFLTITPMIGFGLAGLIASNWDTHIAPVLGDLLNQEIDFQVPDFEALASTITSGWDTYVSQDIKDMFTTLGTGLSEALGTGGEIFTNVITGIKEFGTWCVDNKDAVGGFFTSIGQTVAEDSAGALNLFLDAINGLALIGTDAITGALQWIVTHGEETAAILEMLAIGFAAGAIAAHPYAAAIVAIATALGLMRSANADGDAYNHWFDKYTDEDLATLQEYVDAVNRYREAEAALAQDESNQTLIDNFIAAGNAMEEAEEKASAIDGLIAAYNAWRSGQAENQGKDLYLDVPIRLPEDTESNIQTYIDGMNFESDLTMNTDTSLIQSALNRAGFTAYANIIPSFGSYFGIGSSSVDGSHANGLDYVPRDNYVARLHKGETVLTRSQADAYRSGSMGGSDIGRLEAAINNLGTMLQQISANTAGGHQVVLDSGVLVGQIAPAMDMQLGTISGRKGRRA